MKTRKTRKYTSRPTAKNDAKLEMAFRVLRAQLPLYRKMKDNPENLELFAKMNRNPLFDTTQNLNLYKTRWVSKEAMKLEKESGKWSEVGILRLPFLIAYPPSSASSNSNLCASTRKRRMSAGSGGWPGSAGWRGLRCWGRRRGGHSCMTSSRTTVTRGARSIRRVALNHFTKRVG